EPWRNGTRRGSSATHAAASGEWLAAQTNSGHGTMVDLTVLMAIASATASVTPSGVNGYNTCISSHGYLARVRYSISTPSGRSFAVNAHEPSTLMSFAQIR